MNLVPVEMADRMVALARREAGWRSAAIILAAVLLVILAAGALLLWPVGARAQGYNIWTDTQTLDAPACPNHLPTYERGSAYGCAQGYRGFTPSREAILTTARNRAVDEAWHKVARSVPVRLRHREAHTKVRPWDWQHQVVRVSGIGGDDEEKHEARHVRHPDLRVLVGNEAAVHLPESHRVPTVWRSRDHGVRSLDGVRQFPVRHGRAPGWPVFIGSHRQQPRLRTRKRALGHPSRAGQQLQQQPVLDGVRQDDDRGSVEQGGRHWAAGHRKAAWAWLVCGAIAVGAFTSADDAVAQEVPRAAKAYQRDLTRAAHSVWGMDAPLSALAAQLQQESAYNPEAVSWVGARGLAQMMPATAAGLARQYPELAPVREFDPRWALLAQSRLMHDLYRASFPAASNCQAYAFATASYNQGPGWTKRQRAAAVDSARYFDSAELVNPGKTAANYRETHRYVRRILLTLEPKYVQAGFGPGACTR